MKHLAGGLLLLILLVTLTAPLLASHNPGQVDFEHNLMRPSPDHLLGTDLLGRDVYSRLLYGGRQTLLMAGSATLIAALLGLGLAMAAWLGNDVLAFMITALLDSLLSIPSLLIALVAISLLGSGLLSVILAVGVAGVGAFGRTAQDALRNLERMPYVESAISVGANRAHILRYYLLPNARPVLLAFLGVTFSWALLNGAALTFLGFLGNPNAADWGVMLAAGRQTFAAAPCEALAAGAMLTVTVAAMNRLCS